MLESLRYLEVQGQCQGRGSPKFGVTFPSADRVKVDSGGTVWVFNVGGNNYRSIAAIHFNIGKLFILRILNHRDYDREAWKKEL